MTKYVVEISYPINAQYPSTNIDTTIQTLLASPYIQEQDNLLLICTRMPPILQYLDFDISDSLLTIHSRKSSYNVEQQNLIEFLFNVSMHFKVEKVEHKRTKYPIFYHNKPVLEFDSDFDKYINSFLSSVKQTN